MRKISNPCGTISTLVRKIGGEFWKMTPSTKNFNLFVVKYGGHDKVPFDERGCRNLIIKVSRLSLQEGDFVSMRRHFCEMIESNSDFFYMYNTHENGN